LQINNSKARSNHTRTLARKLRVFNAVPTGPPAENYLVPSVNWSKPTPFRPITIKLASSQVTSQQETFDRESDSHATKDDDYYQTTSNTQNQEKKAKNNDINLTSRHKRSQRTMESLH
jgi:hypothetical protein